VTLTAASPAADADRASPARLSLPGSFEVPDGAGPPSPAATLVLDERGLVVDPGSPAPAEVVAWVSLAGWCVGAWAPPTGQGPGGALLEFTVEPEGAAPRRFVAPGGDPEVLAAVVDDLAARFHPSPPAVPVEAPAGPPGAKVAAVSALLVFLAAAVGLVLAQSAGLVHLPFLGGTGGGP